MRKVGETGICVCAGRSEMFRKERGLAVELTQPIFAIPSGAGAPFRTTMPSSSAVDHLTVSFIIPVSHSFTGLLAAAA